jgi:hypothetical protein
MLTIGLFVRKLYKVFHVLQNRWDWTNALISTALFWTGRPVQFRVAATENARVDVENI